MGRNINIEARRGGGAQHEILFGEVSIEGTALRKTGSTTVFPAPYTVGIANGSTVLKDVQPSPEGPEPEWAYRVTFRDYNSERAWSELVGVPEGISALNYNQLVTFASALPADVTKEQLLGYVSQTQVGAARAEEAATRAEAAASEATAPTDGQNKTLIDDPNTQTRQVLDELYGVMQPVNPDDWFGRIGKKLDIPTPDPASVAGEAVHPSVLYFPGGWNGYRYWMGYTPYAGGNDKYEDPCIAASHDGDTWVVPDGLVNPLDDAPGGVNYNSDTNLTFHDGKLHLVWRNFDNAAVGKEETLWLSISSDGSTWSPKVKIYESNKTVRRLVSPAFQFVKGKWHMWAVDLTPTVKTMVHLTADEMTGPWSVPEVCNVPVKPGKMPWHLNVKRVGNQYVGLLNDTLQGGTGAREGDIYLITSWDGVNFASGSDSVIPRVGPHHDNLYEATFVASDGGFDVWYSARITGSPSVWSILRSRLHRRVPGVPYATAGGNVRLGVIAANGGSDGVSVSFPAGLFTKTPLITASSNNGRVSPGTSAITKDGFTLKGFNWTSGDAVQPYVSWVATQVD